MPVRRPRLLDAIQLKSVRSDALFEANEIVADIQEAYDLDAAA